MSEATNDPAAAVIRNLSSQVRIARGNAGRAEGHLEAVRTVLVQYLWAAQELAGRGEQIPASEIAGWMRQLWDAATLGQQVGSARNTGRDRL